MRANAATMLGTRTGLPSGGIGNRTPRRRGARQDVELHAQPWLVLRAHVHRQRLGDRAEAARLLVAVHPDFERIRTCRSRRGRRRSRTGRTATRPCRSTTDCRRRAVGRPGQRRLYSAGCGAASRRMRRSVSEVSRSLGCCASVSWRCRRTARCPARCSGR